MFGNPFSKFPSVTQFPTEKCRWCLTRIGLAMRYPIPLCDACFMMAYSNASVPGPKQSMWTRMMTEFSEEARIWVKKMSSAPTTLDMMEANTAASGDLAELKKHVAQLRLGGDNQMANALEERLKERTEALAQYKKEMPQILNDLVKVS